MSTRATVAYELAGRARRVGWDVQRVGDGYKVKTPDGTMLMAHLSISDVRGERNLIKNFERAGLLTAEAKLAEVVAASKAKKLTAQRRAADAKAVKLAARQTAITRAAGPYAVLEEVDLDWFLKPHPTPWVRWCMISPELAGALLDKINTHNRPTLNDDVDKYQRILVSGQWRSTHQGIAIDTDGVLQDGQHRLKAITESGVPAPLFVFVGMDPDNFKAIDEGRLRNAAQLLSRDGEKNTTSIASTVRLISVYVSPDPRAQSRIKPTNIEVFDAFYDDADNIRDAVTWARAQPFRKLGIAPSVLAAAYLLLRRANGENNPYVAAFLNGFVAGTKPDSRMLLDDDDPRMRLRNWLANRRQLRQNVKQLDQLAILIKAWNYLIDDRRANFLRHTRDSAIPFIGVCRPDGDEPSPPPQMIADELHQETP